MKALRRFLAARLPLLASLVADLVFLPATILVYRRYISGHR